MARKRSVKRRQARKPVRRVTAKTARKARPKTPMVKARRPQAEPPPEVQLMGQLMGFMVSRAISAAAKLGVSDALARGPLYYIDLAKAVGAHQKTLHRMMRALTSAGVYAEPKPGVFALTPLSNLLRKDVPGSLRDMAVMITTPSHWLPWGRFDEAVVQGVSVAEKTLGADLFTYYARNIEEGQVFNAAMTSFTGMTGSAIAKAYDFKSFQRIVDVGGGHGLLLATVLKHAPAAQGVLFDLPQVVKGAGEHLAPVKDRVEIVSGSFFDFAPEGGDAYLLKHIIHDWDDERCVKILSNIAGAMQPAGRVLVCEMMVPAEPGPHMSHLMDLNMLAMTPGGCERTERQFADLFKQAGLKLAGVMATQSPVNIIEAVKA
ncbi:methyltransferase [bacterium]|nr:MAG: methyltransferase [bacterium]RIK62056.1 MAG: methyltransferase [Planctomycetota bacterium]